MALSSATQHPSAREALSAIAADLKESNAEDYGKCGEDLAWYFSNGTLVIRGTGDITGTLWNKHQADIRAVVIEDGCTSLCERIFNHCYGEEHKEPLYQNLSKVILPNTLTAISYRAFKDCGSLTGVSIPDSVTYIGREAFKGCGSLTGITIPDSVTYIGPEAFEGCRSLTSVTIFDSVECCSDAFGANTQVIRRGAESFV